MKIIAHSSKIALALRPLLTGEGLPEDFEVKKSSTNPKLSPRQRHENHLETPSAMPTLTWTGKEAVVNHHLDVPFRLLKDHPELSCGDPDSGNIVMEGDNLEGLKALLPYYAGKVDCICIDPPYNTGNEGWVYNDNVNSEEIKEWLGKVVGKEAEDLNRHAKWLCMIYPRLKLLRSFLSPEGVIIIHIDEHEQAHLTTILDEIFGRHNRLGEIVWDKGNPKGDSIKIAAQHETILCYANSLNVLRERDRWFALPKPNAEAIIKKSRTLFKRIGKVVLPDDLQAVIKEYGLKPENFEQFKKVYGHEDAQEDLKNWNNANKLLKGGEKPYFRIANDGRVYRLISMAWPNKKKAPDEYFEPITDPTTGISYKPPGRGWRYPVDTVADLLKRGLIEFPPDGKTQPQKVLFLEDNMMESVASIARFAGSDDNLLSALEIEFEHPKPYAFAASLIAAFTKPNSIVLDSFAGSGTTGHAVMLQNSMDQGNRKFVLIEVNPETAKTRTRKRLASVTEGYSTPNNKSVPQLGGGFRYVSLGETLFDASGQIRKSVSFGDLARHVWFTETGSPLPKGKVPNTPLLGIWKGTGIYLLYNGILGDESVNGGNMLTRQVLAALPKHDGPKVIYAAGTKVSDDMLARQQADFKQTPYKIRTR